MVPTAGVHHPRPCPGPTTRKTPHLSSPLPTTTAPMCPTQPAHLRAAQPAASTCDDPRRRPPTSRKPLQAAVLPPLPPWSGSARRPRQRATSSNSTSVGGSCSRAPRTVREDGVESSIARAQQLREDALDASPRSNTYAGGDPAHVRHNARGFSTTCLSGWECGLD